MMSSTKPLVVVAAGGTGGHMFPAQAFAEDGRIWSVRFVLAENANDRLPEQIMAASDSRKVLGWPIALPPDSVLRASALRLACTSRRRAPSSIRSGVTRGPPACAGAVR